MSLNRERMGGGEVNAVELFFGARVQQTMVGALVVGKNAPTMWILDPGGAARNLDMPAEEDVEGKVYFIVNKADAAETITVRNDAAGTIIALAQNESVMIGVFGGVWHILMQGAST